MSELCSLLSEGLQGDPPGRFIVRLETSAWADRRGFYIKKTLRYQKRLSDGVNTLEEDSDAVGALVVAQTIINDLNSCQDGLYQVVLCNLSRDYESGMIDGYDIKLVPYREKKE